MRPMFHCQDPHGPQSRHARESLHVWRRSWRDKEAGALRLPPADTLNLALRDREGRLPPPAVISEGTHHVAKGSQAVESFAFRSKYWLA